jgi:hypothetical protein
MRSGHFSGFLTLTVVHIAWLAQAGHAEGGPTLKEQGWVPIAHGPVDVAFDQPKYEIDPSAADATVGLRVTNNTKATIPITSIGEYAAMVARLPAPVELGAGESRMFWFSLRPQVIRQSAPLTAAVGFVYLGRNYLLTADAVAVLKGLPSLSQQRVSWTLGEKPSERTIKVDLPGGQELTDVRIFGPSDRVMVRVDRRAKVIRLFPVDTSRPFVARLSLVTEPPLHPRLEVPLWAAIAPLVPMPARQSKIAGN